MTADETTSIVLVHDYAVIATSVAMALRASGFRTVTTVGADDMTVDGVLDVARAGRVDVALLDLRAGGGQLGVDLTGRLVATGAKVLLLASTDDPHLVVAGLRAGAEAIIDRSMSFDRLVATLVEVARGRQLMPLEERAALVEALQQRKGVDLERRRPFEALTAREAFVLRCLIDGRSPKQIAHAEGLSISTVRGHIERIFAKLDVSSQREALALARTVRWPDAEVPGPGSTYSSGQYSP